MSHTLYLKIIFALTCGGVLFSGYLSFHRLFSGVCAFNETCPEFFGHPACIYGFVLFLAMFIVDILGLARIVSPQNAVILILGISFIGILFSGQFVIPEIFSALRGNAPHSALGLSTCSYGLIFFVIISIVSIVRYGILF